MTTIPHWIDGQPQPSAGTTIPVTDPATGRESRMSPSLMTPPSSRQRLRPPAHPVHGPMCPRRSGRSGSIPSATHSGSRTELAELVTAQHGKTLDDARGEVDRALESVELACSVPAVLKGEMSEQTGHSIDTFSTLHPLGVVLGITPFNFPLMLPLMMASRRSQAGMRSFSNPANTIRARLSELPNSPRKPASPTASSLWYTANEASSKPSSMHRRSRASRSWAPHRSRTPSTSELPSGKRVGSIRRRQEPPRGDAGCAS